MGRRNKNTEGEGVSLFPFLSILACVIGVLTLLIVSTVLSQVDVPDVEKIERAEKAKQNKDDAAAARADISKLEEMLREAEELRLKLEAAREEMAKLKKQADTSNDPEAEKIKLLAEAKRLQDRIDEMTKAMEELLKQIKELEEEMKKREIPPPPAEVRIIPSGSGSVAGSKPTFMEVTKDTVIIQNEDGTAKPFPMAGIETNLDFIGVLDAVAAQEGKAMVLFLVRDDAVPAYLRLERMANGRNAVNGKLPVIGRGKLNLELFKTK